MRVKKKFIILILIALSLLLFSIFLTSKAAKFEITVSAPTVPIFLKSLIAPILVYHYIEYVTDERDTIRKSLNITPYIFTKQIETLKNANYTFITASELIDVLDGKIKSPHKPILLTFDDGYRDFYTDVFPILKKNNVKATAYIVSGFLDKPNYLFTKQLKEIARSGLVEIGAHSVNHASLAGMSLESVKYEIEESKRVLEKLINVPVDSFAYPNGSFDDQTIRLAKKAGFKSAATTIEGFETNQNNKYSLYRLHPGHKVDNDLLNFLNQK